MKSTVNLLHLSVGQSMYSGLNGLLLRFPSDRYIITYTQGNDGDINNIISDCLSLSSLIMMVKWER